MADLPKQSNARSASASAKRKRTDADERRHLIDINEQLYQGGTERRAKTISFRVRRLEPLLAWGLAGYTLWLGIVLSANGTASWLLVLLAAFVGGWSQMFPARLGAVMLTRALLLLLGVGVVLLDADAGGATGPYFSWLVAIVFFYPLLLPRLHAIVLVLAALAVFGVACWLGAHRVGWVAALTQGAFLVTFAPLLMVFGRSLRQLDNRAESSMRDDRTLLYNETGFFVHGAVLLKECQQRRRPFSMVLLNAADLRDVSSLLGRKAANELFSQAVQRVSSVPGQGIAARIDSVEFALLLPGLTAERATALVGQKLGTPPKVEIEVNGKPVSLVLDIAVAQAQESTAGIEALYDTLHAEFTARQNSNSTFDAPSIFGPDDERPAPSPRNTNPTVALPLAPARR